MTFTSALRFVVVGLVAVAALPVVAQQWQVPTAEELSMTSVPQAPGAPAVILYHEETTDDAVHTFTFYTRMKILTDGGKDLANVELPYVVNNGEQSLDNVAGRTVQPDGTIVPFTGKPYQKMIEKSRDFKVKATVFTLPAVQVGSIIEYRYKLHLDDHYFSSPDWIVQGDLFVRKAHYSWKPTSKLLTSEDGKTSETVAWTPILPPSAKVVQTFPPKVSQQSDEGNSLIVLDVHDIAPLPKEDYMLPLGSISYRVLFYYTSARTADEYWRETGKTWSRNADKFIGPNNAVKDAAQKLVAASDTPEQKAKKLYAAVMALENTDYTRTQTTSENKAAGVRQISNAGDVLTLGRGSSDQLAMVMVGLARAAGLKAYLMGVANRDERIFLMSYLSMRQLDDYIVILNIDGKDVALDPGSRYCTYGQLAWQHTYTGGLRQVDGGTILVRTPPSTYKDEHITRIADLTLDEQGIASGTVTFNYSGDAALGWRHRALRSDRTGLDGELRRNLEHMLPGSIEAKVLSVDNLTDGEQPLKVKYEVKGTVGTATGRRLLVPAHLFEASSKPLFPQAARTLGVDMHYPELTQDAVRYKLPSTLAVEATPADCSQKLGNGAVFTCSVKRGDNNITLYRNMTLGIIFYTVEDYAPLRAFYGKISEADQESLVLTHAVAEAKPAVPKGD